MNSINKKYIITLLAVIVLAIVLKAMNPYQEYSTETFWESATLKSVDQIPEEALMVGNSNGSVLMWAASVVSDPKILAALVERGADINEVEPLFLGTPLSAAAVDNKNPEIIKELIRLGANINARVSDGNTVLMTAAIFNPNPKILEELISQGANINDTNTEKKTALQLAQESKNQPAIKFLSANIKKSILESEG